MLTVGLGLAPWMLSAAASASLCSHSCAEGLASKPLCWNLVGCRLSGNSLRCKHVALWKFLRLWNLLFWGFMSYEADDKGNVATILWLYLVPVHAHCTYHSNIWKQVFLFILMLKDLMIAGLKVNHTVVQSGRLGKKRKHAHPALLCLANSHVSFWYHFLTAINWPAAAVPH